jgi:hypothetical protein
VSFLWVCSTQHSLRPRPGPDAKSTTKVLRLSSSTALTELPISAKSLEPASPRPPLPFRWHIFRGEHHTPIGWNPKPCLNVAAACSFSECAMISVAYTSKTMVPPRSTTAVLEAGTRGSWLHTRRADLGHSLCDPPQHRRGRLIQNPPRRRRRRDRPKQGGLIAQRVHVGDRLSSSATLAASARNSAHPRFLVPRGG